MAVTDDLRRVHEVKLEVERFGLTFRSGDKVIQTRNNYELEVWNGDLGVVQQIQGRSMLVRFDSTYHSARGLTINSLEFDRRLLIGLERSVWDSVTSVLQKRITDAVIDEAVLAVPVEYHPWAPELAARLKVRRDSLSVAAEPM